MAAQSPTPPAPPPASPPAERPRPATRPRVRTVDKPHEGQRHHADDHAPAQNNRARTGSHESTRHGPRSSAEWITLAISSLIVLGLIGLTTYFAFTASDAPAIVEVEPRPAETYGSGDRFYLPVTVRNRGGATGEEVRVRVTLTAPDGRQEAAELMIQFLAGGGSTRAVAAFGSDPRLGQISAGVTSYLEP